MYSLPVTVQVVLPLNSPTVQPLVVTVEADNPAIFPAIFRRAPVSPHLSTRVRTYNTLHKCFSGVTDCPAPPGSPR
jgi:hypothetical protein